MFWITYMEVMYAIVKSVLIKTYYVHVCSV